MVFRNELRSASDELDHRKSNDHRVRLLARGNNVQFRDQRSSDSSRSRKFFSLHYYHFFFDELTNIRGCSKVQWELYRSRRMENGYYRRISKVIPRLSFGIPKMGKEIKKHCKKKQFRRKNILNCIRKNLNYRFMEIDCNNC